MPTAAEKRAAFRRLHEDGFFVLPNPWDVGSALHLQSLGFKALASTSSGFAMTLGKGDYGVTRDQLLDHLRAVSAAIDVPFNADFEGGYAVEPEGVAANVRLAIETGVAGLSIEDRVLGGEAGLLDLELSVARIKAARAEIDRDNSGVILVGRCEGYLVGQPDLGKTIARLQAYAEAGADCLYPPGPRDKDEIAAIVRALAPRPVNILLRPQGPSLAELRDLGVRRASTGGALAFVAHRAFDAAAKDLVFD
ncbi:MAG TPA: isocitrate lyase/phosphoenolpyruvate mutase family protein [Caulobacteraceae bacterium]|nr:isocitrate lyase/phosphoenolpyruvate mutase family protein [Caulobacteraceae bacterium]